MNEIEIRQQAAGQEMAGILLENANRRTLLAAENAALRVENEALRVELDTVKRGALGVNNTAMGVSAQD